jgi:outer membrane protein TolC
MKTTILSGACLATTLALSGCGVNPKPLSAAAHLQRIAQDREALYLKQEPIKGPLTFYQALARALKYNYEHRLATMEAILQDTQLDVATINMLPRIALSAGYAFREPELASSSKSVITGRQSLEPSTSQDRGRGIADLSFNWNLLDFGVSYFQAKQQADRVLIAQERRRKVLNNLIKDVLAAYWSAAIADRLLPRLEPVLADAEKALKTSQEIQADRLQPMLEVLEYQRSLLRVVDQLQKLRGDLSVAKPKLAGLVNAPMGTPLELALPDAEAAPPELKAPLEELEQAGLYFRPDLREEGYQERISRNDAWKELLKTLPGITLPISGNWDSNSYLVHQLWAEAAARTTFNLVNLISAPRIWKSSETQIEVAKTRRRALSVAAIVQINVAWRQYLKAQDGFHNAIALNKVDEGILKTLSDARSVETGSELDRIHAAAAALASQLERERNRAEIYAALGNVYASIGLDPYSGPIEYVSVDALARLIKDNLDRWYVGDLPKIPELASLPKSEDED